jgi:hypothetical protein
MSHRKVGVARPIAAAVLALCVVGLSPGGASSGGAALAVVAARGVAAPGVAAAAARECPAKKIRVTVNGVATCQPRATFAAIVPKHTVPATWSRLLQDDPPFRTNDGTLVPPAYAPAFVDKVVGTFGILSDHADPWLAGQTGLGALAVGAASGALGSAADPGSSDGVPPGHSEYQLPSDAPSGPDSMHVTGKVTFDVGGVNVETQGADSATLGMTVELRSNDMSAAFDFGIRSAHGEADTTYVGNVTTTQKDGVTNRDIFRWQAKGDIPLCPTITGAIPGEGSGTITGANSQLFTLANLSVASAHKAFTETWSWKAQGQMSPQATLQPIPFTLTDTETVRITGEGLLFFLLDGGTGSFTATASGKLDPVSGQPLDGGLVQVTTATSKGQESVKGWLVQQAEKRLRERLGDIAKSFRATEKNARAGGCTAIAASSDRALAPKESFSGTATLQSKDGKAEVRQVAWTVSAGPGTVAPHASKSPTLTFTVTGGKGDPSAVVKLRAVSPAGISEHTWTGSSGYPTRLRVTATGHGELLPATADGDFGTHDWRGVFDLKRSSVTTAGGETRVTYAIETVTIASSHDVDGGEAVCTSTVDYAGTPTDHGGQLILTYPSSDAGKGLRYSLSLYWSATSTVYWSGPPGCDGSTAGEPVLGAVFSDTAKPVSYAALPIKGTASKKDSMTDSIWDITSTYTIAALR